MKYFKVTLYAIMTLLLFNSCTAQETVISVAAEDQKSIPLIIPPSPWIGDSALLETPSVYPTNEVEKEGITSFFYQGLSYEGKPTRVYAYYQQPEGTPPTGGWPAVVCVPGGGGTAFDRWVKIWNEHGYAAIAMDLEGHLPIGKHPDRPKHHYSGPARDGIFNDIDKEEKDQWFYHATGAVIRAHNLLRSFPDINTNQIGIHGISWGGIITSTVVGLDQRFAFAAPIYGCGFLYDSSIPNWKRRFDNMSEQELATYKSKWDPSIYKRLSKMPMFFHIGTYDGSFSLDIYQKSSLLANGAQWRNIPVTAKHGHVFTIEEVYAFADAVIGKRKPLLIVGTPSHIGEIAEVSVANGTPSNMDLVYNIDSGPFNERAWKVLPATQKRDTVQATLPSGTSAFYFNIKDETGLMFSTIYKEI